MIRVHDESPVACVSFRTNACVLSVYFAFCFFVSMLFSWRITIINPFYCMWMDAGQCCLIFLLRFGLAVGILLWYVYVCFTSIYCVFACVGAFFGSFSQPNYLALGPLAAFGLGFYYTADLYLLFYCQ
jgi:hypothetical protein